MSATLNAQLEERITRLRDSGHYVDPNAVLNDALNLLESHQRQVELLRAQVKIGLDEANRGEIDDWTPELRNRLLREAEEMYERGERPDPDHEL